MQFPNGSIAFGDLALITIVRRGNTTSGTVPNIPNVIDVGLHRLAAYADPYDPTSQPFVVSSAFNVIPSPTVSAGGSLVPSTFLPTSINLGLPTNSASASASPARSKNHSAIIIVVAIVCIVIVLVLLGVVLLLLRRRKARSLGHQRVAPPLASELVRSPADTESGAGSTVVMAPRLEKAGTRAPRPRLEQEAAPPPYLFDEQSSEGHHPVLVKSK